MKNNLDDLNYYQTLYTIRTFEETVLAQFPKGVFSGTTHTYLGQEANAAGVLAHLQAGDIVFSNHRCHGHFLAYGGDPRALFAEMMGKPAGVCGGRGGSQHLQWRNFYSNGVQGGIVPVATGMALAEQRLGSQALVICFLGDGTFGEGVIYESFNLAALYGARVLYVVENNRIAQTTPVEQALAGEMAARFTAFGIPVQELDTADVRLIGAAAGPLLAALRAGSAPQALILHTQRFGPHSKGDDTRPAEQVDQLRATCDPLLLQAPRLNPDQRLALETEVEQRIRAAFAQALADPPAAGDLHLERGQPSALPPASLVTVGAAKSVLEALNSGLHQALQQDARVLVLGEDLLDPYGGAFKVTRGLSSAFPAQVLSTPISEAGISGLAAGMALRGLRPVVEIMFGDFVTLAADQLINHAAKFRWMYNDQVRTPLLLRTPMGGRRGYGPTHSQTLEKILMGVPGLRVVAPTALGHPGQLLADLILHSEDPLLFVENKLLYLLPLQTAGDLPDFELRVTADRDGFPVYHLGLRGAPPACLTLVAYGYSAELARQAALDLAYQFEIFVELVVPTQLAPLDLGPILSSLQHTRRLLVVEEASRSLGWGAEVLAGALEALGTGLHAARRVAALDLPVPASTQLEQAVLPGVAQILAAARALERQPLFNAHAPAGSAGAIEE